MGNRGRLHDDHRQIYRAWEHKRWISCLLSYQGIRRQLMGPKSYTELFFLDEVTALSAGHRPCGDCRRTQLVLFKACWLRGNGLPPTTRLADIDNALHDERMARSQGDAWSCALHSLPAGVLVLWAGVPHLWSGRALHAWTPTGYGNAVPVEDAAAVVQLCTPPSIVKAIAAGYSVQTHPSAA
jgi:hypothetical protein